MILHDTAADLVRLHEVLDKLERHIEKHEWSGYDPYDALNSPVLSLLSCGLKAPRLLMTHAMKSSPFNLRPFLLMKRGHNPKALGLFLAGYVKRHRVHSNVPLEKMHRIIELLEASKSEGYHGACWGYNFDWQNMAYFFPRGTPTVVNTAFICDGILDAYDLLKEERLLATARSACDFLLKDIRMTKNSSGICFGYTPMDTSRVYNASLLGARLLARVYTYTNEKTLCDMALEALRYIVHHQHADGSWDYGELSIQRYVDNFHTGFVLECLSDIMKYTRDFRHLGSLEKGIAYYHRHLFLEDGMPKYRNDAVYPADIHNMQGIVTLIKCAHVRDGVPLALNVARWMIAHMLDRKGYFYYRKDHRGINKIDYMRWGQAWAFHALTTLEHTLESGKEEAP